MLYLVPTPLGNLEDVTARSLRVLREVKAVYCEDTRRTRGLLTHFAIHTPALRYDERDARGIGRILERLRSGEDLALVSDSGLPVISDPGLRLVAAARREGLAVTALPGPTAAAAAVAGSGLPGDSFVFLGFLPRGPGKRRRLLEEAAGLERTVVLYESPFRIAGLLELVVAALGPGTPVALVRELSKLHEEWLCASAAEALASLRGRREILGEFVVVLRPQGALPAGAAAPGEDE
ncbi:MAG: 16S rRNA (cytidine(1402)-2'-O)-methyltransferase [Elusimicrobia bacterium]|nr:16S rRNA (cytidine(1402)-2'-O)-methyltransferase [Elusimicrobiota bacterium]